MSTAATQEASPAEGVQHGIKAHSDGQYGKIPVQTRSERFTSTEFADFGPVTGREVDWKYTPIAQLKTIFEGDLNGDAYIFTTESAQEFSVEWLPRETAEVGKAGIPEDRSSAAAWSSFEQVLQVSVTGEDESVVVITRDSLGSEARGAHTVVTAEPNSRGVVVFRNFGKAQLAENVEIVVGDGAQLTVVSVQQWDEDAVHVASHFARIGRDASLNHVVVSLGGKLVRVNPTGHLAEAGGNVELYGAYFADAGQHLEQQVYVNHDAPNTRSRVAYKGALQGQGARSVWIGDVLIGQNAPGTDSYEQNRNLVLTEGTRADSIPNLEIETGDIVGAGHASATGRFDDEQLFYLQARGITEDEARRLVVLGFLTEIVQHIGVPDIEAELIAAIEAELAQTAELARSASTTEGD